MRGQSRGLLLIKIDKSYCTLTRKDSRLGRFFFWQILDKPDILQSSIEICKDNMYAMFIVNNSVFKLM